MKDCLKVKVNQKKILVLVLGCSNKEVVSNQSLVYEILRTIGVQLGVADLKDLQDLGDVSVEAESPDYVVKVCDGKVDVVDFI